MCFGKYGATKFNILIANSIFLLLLVNINNISVDLSRCLFCEVVRLVRQFLQGDLLCLFFGGSLYFKATGHCYVVINCVCFHVLFVFLWLTIYHFTEDDELHYSVSLVQVKVTSVVLCDMANIV